MGIISPPHGPAESEASRPTFPWLRCRHYLNLRLPGPSRFSAGAWRWARSLRFIQ